MKEAGPPLAPPRAMDRRPSRRIAIQQWDGIEIVKACRGAASFEELLPIRDKPAKSGTRAFGRLVQGRPHLR